MGWARLTWITDKALSYSFLPQTNHRSFLLMDKVQIQSPLLLTCFPNFPGSQTSDRAKDWPCPRLTACYSLFLEAAHS